jgi:hypothetical protein
MRRILTLLFLAVCAVWAADLSGRWPGTLETAMGRDGHDLTLAQNGTALTGTVAFSGGKWDIRNTSLEGEKLRFEVKLDGMVLAYDLRVSGDEMSGTVTAREGGFPGGKVGFKRSK